MSRSHLHPRTNIWWLRRRVPADLVAVLGGKKEVSFSLHTRDPIEAKARHAVEMVKLEQSWAALRAGSRTLSEREARDIARDVHDGWLTRHRDEPSQQTFWSLEVGKKVFAPPAPIDMDKFGTPEFWTLDPDIGRITTLQDWCIGYADHELRARGLIVDDGSRHKLAKAIAAAVQRASEVLARLSKGEIVPSSQVSVHVSQAVSVEAAVSKPAKTVSFDDLVKGWSAEKKPALKTVYEWPRSSSDFTEFLGSTDATSVTPDDV